jgi:hypothetical protein
MLGLDVAAPFPSVPFGGGGWPAQILVNDRATANCRPPLENIRAWALESAAGTAI